MCQNSPTRVSGLFFDRLTNQFIFQVRRRYTWPLATRVLITQSGCWKPLTAIQTHRTVQDELPSTPPWLRTLSECFR